MSRLCLWPIHSGRKIIICGIVAVVAVVENGCVRIAAVDAAGITNIGVFVVGVIIVLATAAAAANAGDAAAACAGANA